MKEEGDALSNDAIDHQQSSATPSTSLTTSVKVESNSNSRVSSSTNGTGSVHSVSSGVSVISSPLRRSRTTALEAVDLVRAQIYGNALVTIGTDLAAAAAAAASGMPFPVPSTEQNRILMQELANVAARNALSGANSTHSKSSSDGSNSASPLSLSIGVSSPNRDRSHGRPTLPAADPLLVLRQGPEGTKCLCVRYATGVSVTNMCSKTTSGHTLERSRSNVGNAIKGLLGITTWRLTWGYIRAKSRITARIAKDSLCRWQIWGDTWGYTPVNGPTLVKYVQANSPIRTNWRLICLYIRMRSRLSVRSAWASLGDDTI